MVIFLRMGASGAVGGGLVLCGLARLGCGCAVEVG
jgi:hypothetical protein